MKKPSKKGFTLVELIVVITIIVILAAIAIPVFSSYIDDANKAVDLANSKSIYTMAQLFVAKHNITTDEELREKESQLLIEIVSSLDVDEGHIGFEIDNGKISIRYKRIPMPPLSQK